MPFLENEPSYLGLHRENIQTTIHGQTTLEICDWRSEAGRGPTADRRGSCVLRRPVPVYRQTARNFARRWTNALGLSLLRTESLPLLDGGARGMVLFLVRKSITTSSSVSIGGGGGG